MCWYFVHQSFKTKWLRLTVETLKTKWLRLTVQIQIRLLLKGSTLYRHVFVMPNYVKLFLFVFQLEDIDYTTRMRRKISFFVLICDKSAFQEINLCLHCLLTFTTLWANAAEDRLMIFFLLFFSIENRKWHFMQFVSSGDNLHVM